MLLHNRISGSGQQIVVLIHGLFGNLDNLKSMGKTLEKDYTVLCVDLRNHGLSFRDDAITYTDMAADIQQLLRDSDLKKPAWFIGHSMGGKVAMRLALDSPEIVAGLIVADIAPTAYPPDRHDQILEALHAVTNAPHIQNRRDADLVLQNFIQDMGTRQFLLKSFYTEAGKPNWRFNVDAIQKNYLNICDWPDHSETYTGPTLFIKGELSDYMHEKHTASIPSHFPGAKLETLEGTGHWLHAEKPNEFNKLVKDFFESIWLIYFFHLSYEASPIKRVYDTSC